MTITTVTTLNSTYELDHDNLRARRVKGVHVPTANLVRNGMWHQLVEIRRVQYFGGHYAYKFIWPDGRMTITSLVRGESIEDVDRQEADA